MRLLPLLIFVCLQLAETHVLSSSFPVATFLNTTVLYAIRARDSSTIGVRQRIVGFCDKNNEAFNHELIRAWMSVLTRESRNDPLSEEHLRQIQVYLNKMDEACEWRVDSQFAIMKRFSNNQSLPYPFGMRASLDIDCSLIFDHRENSSIVPCELIPCNDERLSGYGCDHTNGSISTSAFSEKLDRMIRSGVVLKLGEQIDQTTEFTNMWKVFTNSEDHVLTVYWRLHDTIRSTIREEPFGLYLMFMFSHTRRMLDRYASNFDAVWADIDQLNQ